MIIKLLEIEREIKTAVKGIIGANEDFQHIAKLAGTWVDKGHAQPINNAMKAIQTTALKAQKRIDAVLPLDVWNDPSS